MPQQRFLRDLGARLRGVRQERGRSLSEVAREAEVSRRYLTEAEAGRANPSALVLARLSRALAVPLPELVSVPSRRPGERIALVGLRGAGKSTLGRRLARALEVPFVELDQRVEAIAGLALSEIFAVHGEEGFHRFEAEALEQVLSEGERVVIATGGSIVAAAETFDRLRATCRTVWLRATPEEHFRRVVDQGDARPMRDRPRAMEELRALLASREPLYGRCDVTVETADREEDQVADELIASCVAE